MPNLTRAQLAGMPKRVRDAVASAKVEAEKRTTAASLRRERELQDALQDTVADPRMTLTEQRYAAKLDDDPGVLKWWFEPHDLSLGRRCDYTPDFYVVFKDDRAPEYHEIKGEQVWDDSRIKFKWAGEKYRAFRFAWCQWKDGVWKVNHYTPLEERS